MKFIFNTDDYKFSRYRKNEEGMSGKLYLATNKEDENDLWVVKGEFFDHALNEFVISMFANELNVLVPECKLAFYRDKLAAFIKYLPNIRLLSKKEAQEDAEVFEDYLKQFFIGAVFYNDDHLEVFIDDEKRVWQLDNAEGGLGSLKFHMRVLEMSEADKRFKEHFVNYIKGMEEKAEKHLRFAVKNVSEYDIGRQIAFNTLLDIIKLGENSESNDNIKGMFEAITKLLANGENIARLYATYLSSICNAAKKILVEFYSENIHTTD